MQQGSEQERPKENVTLSSGKGMIESQYWPCAWPASVVRRRQKALAVPLFPMAKNMKAHQDQEKELRTLAFLTLSDLESLRNQSSFSIDGCN